MISKLVRSAFLTVSVLTLVLPEISSLEVLHAAEIELGKGVFVEVTSLRKKDLPRGFPFQVFQEGFAILGVLVRNDSSADFHLDPEEMEARNHKKKPIERARSTDITPKIMKYHRAGQIGTPGGIHTRSTSPVQDPRYGGQDPRYGRGANRTRGRTVDVGGGGSTPGVVGAGEAQKVRALLEEYEIQPRTIPAGETVEGFFYLKSKKSGRKLTGQLLLLQKDEASVPF